VPAPFLVGLSWGILHAKRVLDKEERERGGLDDASRGGYLDIGETSLNLNRARINHIMLI
jgi:hypothetical protein